MKLKILFFTPIFIGAVIVCHAQTQQDSIKQNYNLFNPTPKDQMRDFDMDRPDVTESSHTVDAGHFQYEADLFNTTQSKFGNRKSLENYFNATNLKLGLTNCLDLQLVVSSLPTSKWKGHHFELFDFRYDLTFII